jgi:hypothetical protein
MGAVLDVLLNPEGIELKLIYAFLGQFGRLILMGD